MRARRCVCSALLIAAGVALLIVDLAACGRDRPRRGLTNLKSCRIGDADALCGSLGVYENPETRAGRKVDIYVVVLPALDQKNKREPLFDLAGGPGASSAGGCEFYAGPGSIYRRSRDVVCIDQRGTGKSNPLAIPREKTPQYYLGEMYPPDYVQRMRAELEPRADLTQYTTSIAMDDLDDVRAWLGYERINLFGLSYGTRAALVYLRRHPEHVQTLTLLGVCPTNFRMPMYHAQAAARAIELLLGECERDAACHAAFPHIRADWTNVIARLTNAPGNAKIDNDKIDISIEREIFAEKIRTWMYSREHAARIPLIIHHAAAGDFAPFLHEAIAPNIPDFIADGMYLSVTCAEDVPFIDQGEAARMNAANPFGNYRVFQQTRACSMWPRGKIPANFLEPVESDAPVLMFAGNFDPVTPPQRAEEVSRTLPNSRIVSLPEAAHGVDGLTNSDCIDRIAVEFMDRGDAKNLDVRCVATMAPPPFATN